MMEEFMKLLSKKAKEQKEPADSGRIKALASVSKELGDVLGMDLTEDMKKKMSESGVVKAGFTAPKEAAPEAAEKLKEVVESKFGDEESEESEDESPKEMYAHGSSEEHEPEHKMHRMGSESKISELENKIAQLSDELMSLKSKKA